MALPPLRPHEQPWKEGPPQTRTADELSNEDNQGEKGDLPFFLTNEVPRRPDAWTDDDRPGVPTGLPPLLDWAETPDSASTSVPTTGESLGEPVPTEDTGGFAPPGADEEPQAFDATPAGPDEPPLQGWQLFGAGLLLGGVFCSVATYWFAVGF